MLMKIAINDSEVLETGSIILFDEEKVLFDFEISNNKVQVVVYFSLDSNKIDDKNGFPTSYYEKSHDICEGKNIFTLKLINMNHILPISTIGDIDIFTVSNQSVKLRFSVSSNKSGDTNIYNFTYTWKKQAN